MYKKPKFDYDEESDVMYITFGKAKPCRSIEIESGFVIRYTLNGELNGITLVDYSKRVSGEKKQQIEKEPFRPPDVPPLSSFSVFDRVFDWKIWNKLKL